MDLFTALEDWKRKGRIVQDCDSLEKMVYYLTRADVIAVDTETTGLDIEALDIVGIGFATLDFGSWYVPLNHIINHPQLSVASVFGAIEHFFKAPDKTFIFHNAKFDIKVLQKYGIDVPPRILDTMIMSWLLDEEGRHKLKILAKRYLGIRMTELDEVAPDKNPANSSITLTGRYCRMDAKCTLNLAQKFLPMLKEEVLDRALRLEMELLPVVIAMENNGAYIDEKKLKELKVIVDDKVQNLKTDIQQEAGFKFNVNSSNQLSDILFKNMGMKPIVFTDKEEDEFGKKTPSTNVEAIKALQREHPDNSILEYILGYRHYNKIKTTYIDPMFRKIRNDIVYASFNQLGAETGRFSSENPNLQNIPRMDEEDELKIRNVFYAPPRFELIIADYNQIELRVMAHFCEDENMLNAFKSGKDIHKSTASIMFDVPFSKVTKTQRQEAKALNFGLVYGMRVYGLANRIGKYDDIPYAQELMDKYFEIYKNIKPWSNQEVIFARSRGFVRTLVGRKRRLKRLNDTDGSKRKGAERKAINTIVQGSAADVIKGAMIKLYGSAKLRDLDVKMQIQVHDEIVFICPKENVDEALPEITEIMEHPFRKELRIPVTIKAGVGTYWGDAK